MLLKLVWKVILAMVLFCCCSRLAVCCNWMDWMNWLVDWLISVWSFWLSWGWFRLIFWERIFILNCLLLRWFFIMVSVFFRNFWLMELIVIFFGLSFIVVVKCCWSCCCSWIRLWICICSFLVLKGLVR